MGSVQHGHATMIATMLVHDKWVPLDPLADDPAILNGGTEAGEFFVRRSRDPARAARLSTARKKLGQGLDATYGGRTALVALRMKAGLSQTELAQRIGTQQPSVARWERSPEKMGYETIEAWANSLGVDTMDVCAAIKAQRQIEKAHEAA
ncbi:MAG: hypothetical protein JWP77_302 [Polaromonas sp.]|jgi:ribosome-binding protein aMBF1 (putative translation factor)|nr:hypothetical protein [Polaromonas sp.]